MREAAPKIWRMGQLPVWRPLEPDLGGLACKANVIKQAAVQMRSRDLQLRSIGSFQRYEQMSENMEEGDG